MKFNKILKNNTVIAVTTIIIIFGLLITLKIVSNSINNTIAKTNDTATVIKNIEGFDISQLDLTSVSFKVALNGVSLSGLYLSGVDFSSIDLSSVDTTVMTTRELTDVDLTDVIVSDIDLTSFLTSNDILDLTGLTDSFDSNIATKIDLSEANITQAFFENIDVSSVDLSGVDLTNAIISDVLPTSFDITNITILDEEINKLLPPDTTTTPAATTTTSFIQKYNSIVNKIDELLDEGVNSAVPTDLKIDLLELNPAIKTGLCKDYCQVYGDCTPLCDTLGCDNCSGYVRDQINSGDVYRQPDELAQNQVPQTIENRHILQVPAPQIHQNGNGESNIFAPYVVVHKKKPGQRYNAYVMSNPYDPNYYSYINNLS